MKELVEAEAKLAKWLRENQEEKTGTEEYRAAILLHRQAVDMIERNRSETAS